MNVRALTDSDGPLTRDFPDWDCRSALTIEPGRWTMRNRGVAIVDKLINLQYESQLFRGKRDFPVWKGRLECCGTPMTWNVNGTYAAVGKHDFDLIEAISRKEDVRTQGGTFNPVEIGGVA